MLTDVAANVSLPGGERFTMAGLMMVDERKLQALPDGQVMRLFRSGELAWIYSHLLSIGNFARLPGKAAAPESPGFREKAAPVEKATPPGKAVPATGKGQEPAHKPGKK